MAERTLPVAEVERAAPGGWVVPDEGPCHA